MRALGLQLRRLGAAGAVAFARHLPVSWLRSLNRQMHRTPWGQRALVVIRRAVADQPATIPRGPLAGWRVIAGGGQPGYLLGASEPDLQAALVTWVKPGDVVYDIGANVGFFTLLAACMTTARGYVYAFEPVDANADALLTNLQLNEVRHVEIVRSAVGESIGAVRMAVGANHATAHLSDRGDDLIAVPGTTVDGFVAAGARSPDLVKIDVEGAEDLVLAGMKSTLENDRPVVLCEIHYQDGDPRRLAISELLSSAGYSEQELWLDGGSMPHLFAAPVERASPRVA